jgi:hypothetical protein
VSTSALLTVVVPAGAGSTWLHSLAPADLPSRKVTMQFGSSLKP